MSRPALRLHCGEPVTPRRCGSGLVLGIVLASSPAHGQDNPATQTAPGAPPSPGKAAPAVDPTVIVVVATPSERSSIDRTTYAVRDNAESRIASVLDILARIPSVELTQSGELRLFGRTGVKILIDGREVSNPLTVLRNLQGSQIAQVEVISNPSAQFSSQGTAGIINVITRRSSGSGLGGSLTANVGTFGSYDTKFSPTWSRGKLSLSASVGASRTVSKDDFRRERTGLDATADGTVESGRSRAEDHALKASVFATLRLTKHDTISSTIFAIRGSATRSSVSTLRSLDASDVVNQAATRKSRFHLLDYSVEYRRDSDRKGESLTASIQRSANTLTVDEFFLDQVAPGPAGTFSINDRGSEDVISGKVDYVRPSGKHRLLSAGASIEHRSDNSSSLGRGVAPFGNPLAPAASAIHATWIDKAAYITYQFPFLGLTLLPGLRVESRDYLLAGTGSVAVPARTHFFPTVHIERQLSASTHVDLSYSRRIAWPNVGQLNAALSYRDPTTATIGNPLLRPELTDALEAKLSTRIGKQSVDLTAYNRTTHDLISALSELDSDKVLITRTVNLGDLTLSGVDVSIRGPLGRHWRYSATGDVAAERLDQALVSGAVLRMKPRYSFVGQVEYRDGVEDRPGADHVTLAYRYRGPVVRGLSSISAYSTVSASWLRVLTNRFAAQVDVAGIVIPRHTESANYSPSAQSRDFYGSRGVKITASLTYALRPPRRQ